MSQKYSNRYRMSGTSECLKRSSVLQQAPESVWRLIGSPIRFCNKTPEWSDLHGYVNKWCLILHECLLGARHPKSTTISLIRPTCSSDCKCFASCIKYQRSGVALNAPLRSQRDLWSTSTPGLGDVYRTTPTENNGWSQNGPVLQSRLWASINPKIRFHIIKLTTYIFN